MAQQSPALTWATRLDPFLLCILSLFVLFHYVFFPSVKTQESCQATICITFPLHFFLCSSKTLIQLTGRTVGWVGG